jgi:hypothetical protein
LARKKRKPNSGSFKPGPDPRRHQLTHLERCRGYQSLMMAIRAGQVSSRTAAHLRRKIRQTCTGRKREGERIAQEQRQRDAESNTPDNEAPF